MRPMLTTPAYGGDWSPEQWDSATIDADITLMKEAGVNLVSLGIFSWAFLEPSEGSYDFDWLEDIITRLHAAGIATDLATGTASPPAWMAATYPHSLPVDARGVRLGFGSRQQYCPSSAVFRGAAQRLTRAIAQRFADHPGVVMWHVSNEYGCHVSECFCHECVEAFRTWLRDTYASIDALNAAWGTAFWSQRYTAFDQVGAPGAMPTFHNPAHALDWRRFSNDNLLSLMIAERDIIRQYSSAPVTTNFMGDFPRLDYQKWAGEVDIISDDSYPDPADPAAAHSVAWAGDIMRGLANGSSWLLMEQSPSAVQWRQRNSPKRPGQYLLWTLGRMAHGADGILQFQWRQSLRGSETFHAAMVPHSGKDSRTWGEVVRTGEVLSRLAPVMDAPYRADVAVVMDWQSMWAFNAAIGPVEGTHFERPRAWHRSLWEAGIAVDVVGDHADLSAYRVIIVAEHFIDSPDLTRRLQAAVEAGAQVLIEGPTAVVDRNLGAVPDGYLGSARQLLGVRVIEHAALTGAVESFSAASNGRGDAVNRLSRAVGTPAACEWIGVEAHADALRRATDRLGTPAPDLRAGQWAEEIAPAAHSWHDSGVEVVATFDGRGGGADLANMAAITRRSYAGGGNAWYVACDLDALSRRALLDVVGAYGRVRPVVDGLPDGVEAQRRGNFLFLLNHSDRAVELTGIVGRDLVDGAQCHGHVMLAPRCGMVVDQR
ncbi:beta-galactosidase [Schaalia suimastitidis]|uniref:beta-galactosidase n=1 Tax=Schaalia suimastitidis TaxID=121163 RepID=UPI0003FC5D3C|nr:beta-galactosidase [Schaalia suimastitidis]